MKLLNLIKMFAIWGADTVNKVYYPFKEVRYSQSQDLKNLEERFSKDLEANFKDRGWFLYQKPMPEDAGDHALFQGLYVGMLALKGAEIKDSFFALSSLFKSGILIRGYTRDLEINDTTSNDAATGALFGLYCIYKYVSPIANDLIIKWARQIVDSNYALTDLSGKPTKYGQLDAGIKTDPLRITLLLAILLLASKVDRSFEEIYEKEYQKYREILPYPKARLLWLDTDYDTHRAAIHLHILWDLNHDTVYKEGLRRLARVSRADSNPWVQVLCSPVLSREEVNLSLMNTFDETMIERRAIYSQKGVTVPTVKWGKHLRAIQPLPMNLRGSQEFFWQRNMFSVNEWAGITEPTIRHSNLDFLLVYWMAKRKGLTIY